jgi:hypothetical protein
MNCQNPRGRRVRGRHGQVETRRRTGAAPAEQVTQPRVPPVARSRAASPHPFVSPNPSINCSGTRTSVCSTGGARRRPRAEALFGKQARDGGPRRRNLGPAHGAGAAGTIFEVCGEHMGQQPRPPFAGGRRIVSLAEQHELIAARGRRLVRGRVGWRGAARLLSHLLRDGHGLRASGGGCRRRKRRRHPRAAAM